MRLIKKEDPKLNGFIGKFRFLMVSLLAYVIFYPLIFVYKSLWPTIFSILIIMIVLNIGYNIYRKLNKVKYNFRLLSETEWEKWQHRNVIHYCHSIQSEGEGILMPAHFSERTNYWLPRAYRKQGFVWFHLSDTVDPEEPILNSFLAGHFFEGSPRKYKVIVPVSDLPKERTFIDVSTGYILIQNDFICDATVASNFPWYNKKVYWMFVIKSGFEMLINISCAWNQIIGDFNDMARKSGKLNKVTHSLKKTGD